MTEPILVSDENGHSGHLTDRSSDGTHVLLRRSDGREAWIDANLVSGDRIRVSLDPMVLETQVVPVVEERLLIGREAHEMGVVRMYKTVEERPEIVRTEVVEETVSVERVPVNRILDGPVEVRQEGGVTIVPVYEEIVVVEKRLMLREEVRIIRTQSTVPQEQTVVLRAEKVVIERDSPES